jgi:hypothetical protein
MKKDKPIKRSDDNTTLTISLAKSLKARIEEAATADKRKVSPWIAIQLEELLDDMEANQSKRQGNAPLLKVAETPDKEPMPKQVPVKYPKGR